MTSSSIVSPAPESVALFVGQLLGKKVTAKSTKAWSVGPSAHGYVGLYKRDQGVLVAAAVADLSLSANAAAALVLVPPGAVSDCIRSGQLSPNLLENMHEVFNICTRFFNTPGQPRVVLESIVPCPPALPPDVAKFLTAHASGQTHLELAIAGYGGGRLSIIA